MVRVNFLFVSVFVLFCLSKSVVHAHHVDQNNNEETPIDLFKRLIEEAYAVAPAVQEGESLKQIHSHLKKAASIAQHGYKKTVFHYMRKAKNLVVNPFEKIFSQNKINSDIMKKHLKEKQEKLYEKAKENMEAEEKNKEETNYENSEEKQTEGDDSTSTPDQSATLEKTPTEEINPDDQASSDQQPKESKSSEDADGSEPADDQSAEPSSVAPEGDNEYTQ